MFSNDGGRVGLGKDVGLGVGGAMSLWRSCRLYERPQGSVPSFQEAIYRFHGNILYMYMETLFGCGRSRIQVHDRSYALQPQAH